MNIDSSDPYAVLGVSPRATQPEVRRAYRALMRQNHPDTESPAPASGTAPELQGTTPPRSACDALGPLVAAYEILGDPARRADYDRRRVRARNRAATEAQATIRIRVDLLGRPDELMDQNAIRAGPVRWHAGPGCRPG